MVPRALTQTIHTIIALVIVLATAVGIAQAAPALRQTMHAPELDIAQVLLPSNCPVRPQYPLPSTSQGLQQALQATDAMMEHCLHDGNYYAWRGALQLALGRNTAAIESLERALLLDPALPGAQLDYAQALITDGDYLAAQALIEQLQLRTDLPSHLRPMLRQSQLLLAAAIRYGVDETITSEPSSYLSRWKLSSALSHDSNLNNAPAASNLTLTFPQGPLTLPLDSDYRPRTGAAWYNAAQWQIIKPLDEQALLLSAQLRTRTTAQNGRTGYLQTELSGYWLQAPAASAQWVGRLAWSRLEFGNTHWLTTAHGSLQRQWRMDNTCRAGWGMEAENRRYPTSPELNGNYLGTLFSLHCNDGTDADATTGYGVQIRWGQDRPHHSQRPGGRYARSELRLNWATQLPFHATRLSADYHWTRQNDSRGYSPLLENNATRHSRRHGMAVNLDYPLPSSYWGHATAFVMLEANRQHSNITSFSMRQRSVTAGLRWETD